MNVGRGMSVKVTLGALCVLWIPVLAKPALCQERAVPPTPSNPHELVIATDEQGTRAPLSTPGQAPVPRYPVRPPREDVLVTGFAMSVLSPLVAGAHIGNASMTWGGVSFLSYNGRVWIVPPRGQSGATGRIGGFFALAEGKPFSVYRLDLAMEAGWRQALDRDHNISLSVGFRGSGAMAFQQDDRVFQFPQATLAWQWHGRDAFLEIGPLTGLSVAGRFAVGKKMGVKEGTDYWASTHYLRPYVGAHASFVMSPLMLSVVGRRTYLGDADTGPDSVMDQLSTQTCLQLSSQRNDVPFGGCLVGDVYRGEVSYRGPDHHAIADAWSYRLSLNLMFAMVKAR